MNFLGPEVPNRAERKMSDAVGRLAWQGCAGWGCRLVTCRCGYEPGSQCVIKKWLTVMQKIAQTKLCIATAPQTMFIIRTRSSHVTCLATLMRIWIWMLMMRRMNDDMIIAKAVRRWLGVFQMEKNDFFGLSEVESVLSTKIPSCLAQHSGYAVVGQLYVFLANCFAFRVTCISRRWDHSLPYGDEMGGNG